jgi:hypothetical protein
MIESTADGDDYRNITTFGVFSPQLFGALMGAGAISTYPESYEFINSIVTPISFLFLAILLYFVPNPICRKVEKQPDLIPSVRNIKFITQLNNNLT